MNIEQCIDQLKSQFDVLGIVNCDNYHEQSIDLYTCVKNLHKESYSSSERLIFVITKDTYKQDSNAGLVLQGLQAMLNDIDISNFFVCLVTTNSDAEKEYQWVLDNVSSDKVPANVYSCSGSYIKQHASNSASPYTKYQKLSDYDSVNTLSPAHKKLLFESDNFCMIPWTSMMISPSSEVKPCCEFSGVVGDCSEKTLKEIWNSDELKNLRQEMLSGAKPKSCQNCYTKESLGRDTLRKTINRRFATHAFKVDLTKQDGSLENFDLNYLDARFNNLCNLACRSCGPEHSSSWFGPATYIGMVDKSSKALRIAGKNNTDIYDQIIEHIDTIERIYFAGGEPLMIEQFYQLVDELNRRQRHDVELIYNINMTKSSLAGRSIFDAWKNFKHISIGASLDGEDSRGEYLRTGQKWQDVLEFRKTMMSLRPDIDFYVSATVSLLNVLHLPDFHKSWVEKNLIKPKDFNIQLLFYPGYLRVDHAPPTFKKRIKEKYDQHLKWLRPLDPLGRAVFGFESVINFLENNNEFDAETFWKNISSLDQYHGQDLISVFPELKDLPRD